MRITVLGGCGGWPAAGQACSGYLVEHEDFRLLVDPGYAILPRLLEDAYVLYEFAAGDRFEVGPFAVDTWPLPHSMPNAGLRLTAAGRVLAYTGDTGPSPEVVDLARDADVFLAEASYPERVPADAARHLSSALQAGEHAARADARRLLLTHLLPGTAPEAAVAAARRAYPGEVAVAQGGLTVLVG
jgi:ribonuclease BN (tRNA processing enzyme)